MFLVADLRRSGTAASPEWAERRRPRQRPKVPAAEPLGPGMDKWPHEKTIELRSISRRIQKFFGKFFRGAGKSSRGCQSTGAIRPAKPGQQKRNSPSEPGQHKSSRGCESTGASDHGGDRPSANRHERRVFRDAIVRFAVVDHFVPHPCVSTPSVQRTRGLTSTARLVRLAGPSVQRTRGLTSTARLVLFGGVTDQRSRTRSEFG